MSNSIINTSLVGQLLSAIASYWLLTIVGLVTARTVYRRWLHPLHKVPGPFMASISRYWLLYTTLEGKQHERYIAAHKKYGPIVRIKPNTVIINAPEWIQQYYSWDRSDWWLAFRLDPKIVSHGNALDMKSHNIKKQKVAGAFSMTSILRNEQKMDQHIVKLKEHLTKFAKAEETFDIAPWTSYIAFDLVTEMLFSNPPGFLEKGEDVGGLVESVQNLLFFGDVLATFPILSQLIRKPYINKLVAPQPTDKSGPGMIHGFARGQVRQRLKEGKTDLNDVLQWTMNHKDRDGNHMEPAMLEKESIDQVSAGSDSTSANIRAVILYVSTNPRILAKLQNEIDKADAAGHLSKPVAKFDEIQTHVPYIQYIVKEGLRIMPVAGIPFYRKVPAAGVHLGDHFLPGGTEVGLTQWSVAYNPEIWGSDVNVFRPERWINDDSVPPEQRRLVNLGDVFFSGGPMMCTGRNLAIVELHRVLVELFRTYEFTIVNPMEPWKMKDSMAMIHWDFFVRLRLREGVETIA